MSAATARSVTEAVRRTGPGTSTGGGDVGHLDDRAGPRFRAHGHSSIGRASGPVRPRGRASSARRRASRRRAVTPITTTMAMAHSGSPTSPGPWPELRGSPAAAAAVGLGDAARTAAAAVSCSDRRRRPRDARRARGARGTHRRPPSRARSSRRARRRGAGRVIARVVVWRPSASRRIASAGSSVVTMSGRPRPAVITGPSGVAVGTPSTRAWSMVLRNSTRSRIGVVGGVPAGTRSGDVRGGALGLAGHDDEAVVEGVARPRRCARARRTPGTGRCVDPPRRRPRRRPRGARASCGGTRAAGRSRPPMAPRRRAGRRHPRSVARRRSASWIARPTSHDVRRGEDPADPRLRPEPAEEPPSGDEREPHRRGRGGGGSPGDDSRDGPRGRRRRVREMQSPEGTYSTRGR